MSVVHVALLERVKLRVLNERQLICALIRDEAVSPAEWAPAEQIERHIYYMLGNVGTLEDWLVSKGHLPVGRDHTPYTVARVRATRVAWIDWLIEQWRDEP